MSAKLKIIFAADANSNWHKYQYSKGIIESG
jgi:hypothetical protein